MAFDSFSKLAQSIATEKCAVIIGAGVSSPLLPTAAQLAKVLETYLPEDHPSRHDTLASVAQAVSTLNQPAYVKALVTRYLRKRLLQIEHHPDVIRTHDAIAQLPASIFITTNYDDILWKSLVSAGKQPQLVIAPWTPFADPSIPTSNRQRPTIATPLVLHLHGHIDFADTIVLTEDDYIQFLFAMAIDVSTVPRLRGRSVLPLVARPFLSAQNLLMLGYRAADINFRLLVKSADALTQAHQVNHRDTVRVSVQLPPSDGQQDATALSYIEGLYQHSLSFSIFWGSAYDFLGRLAPEITIARDGLTRAGAHN